MAFQNGVEVGLGRSLNIIGANQNCDSFTEQILEHYKQLQALEVKIKEILDTQQECLQIATAENKRYKEVHSTFDFNVMFKQVSVYTKKLANIHSDMVMIKNRMDRLKHRTKAIKEHQDIKVKKIQEAKALHEERERLLTAKPVWETSQTNVDQT